MKHALLSLACIAIALSGCKGSHQEPKKEIPNAASEVEEIEILEILPEKETRGNGGQNTQAETFKTTTSTSTLPAETQEKDADQALIQSIRRALADDAILARYVSIKITSNNGEVVLRGVVESPQEKEALEKKIRTIRGVKKLNDQLEVIPEPIPHTTQANQH